MEDAFKDFIEGTRELGLQVNEEKTKYMITTRHVKQSEDLDIDRFRFAHTEFRYLGVQITEDTDARSEVSGCDDPLLG